MPAASEARLFRVLDRRRAGPGRDKPDAPFHLPMSQDTWLYYFTLVVTIAIYIFSVNLLKSRSGRAFMAIRDNEIALPPWAST